ncbi:MAG: hypothetical protein H0A76_06870 [Candidatus Thiodubiliella endoseptemdiera]|uniref:Uncharacterized protein n=1 Tax=Candidatus Thiodubiliella endoseptemdiera TaxID=2738886 RepID=A0A853F116_9GAMM|nr:hypothetical protein [Candidatus Thiodubiliella endoseptemdiera]
MKNLIKTTLTILILASTLSTTNAKSITDECNTGDQCSNLGVMYKKAQALNKMISKQLSFPKRLVI